MVLRAPISWISALITQATALVGVPGAPYLKIVAEQPPPDATKGSAAASEYSQATGVTPAAVIALLNAASQSIAMPTAWAGGPTNSGPNVPNTQPYFANFPRGLLVIPARLSGLRCEISVSAEFAANVSMPGELLALGWTVFTPTMSSPNVVFP